MSFRGKTMFISGASRGIGLAIAKRVAAEGANIALIAKTAEPHPKLPGTVYTAAREIEDVGGQALPIVGDVRDGDSVASAVTQAVEQFGGIDMCVNNASAINLGSVEEVSLKRFDLMNGIQVRGTYTVSQPLIARTRVVRRRRSRDRTGDRIARSVVPRIRSSSGFAQSRVRAARSHLRAPDARACTPSPR